MKRTIFIYLSFLLISLSFVHIAYAQSLITPEEYQLNLYKAKVLEIEEIPSGVSSGANIIQLVQIEILNKELKGTVTQIRNTLSGNPAYDIELKKGTLVSVHKEQLGSGETLFFLMGYERTNYIMQIVGIFIICLIVIGGIKGVKAIVSLAVTIFLVIYMLIPLLLKGYNPILVSVLTCGLAAIVALIIIAGWNTKSQSAIIGTVTGIMVGGLLAYGYGIMAKLTGFDSTEAQMLLYLPQQIEFDYRGLLFAGILLGALGAAMDVSISISSALTELFEKDPKLTFKGIMGHGMNIGRDIMGTMANTLILAYTGGGPLYDFSFYRTKQIL